MSKLIGMHIKAISIEPSLVNIHRHQRPPNVLREVQKEEVLLQVVLQVFFFLVPTFPMQQQTGGWEPREML